MNKSVVLCAVLVAIVALGACTQQAYPPANNQPSAPPPSKNSVTISNFAFAPAELTIKIGDTVTWTNDDSAPHTVTSDSGSELASQSFGNGQTYSHTFNQAGTYSYHCSIHASMKAKVIVE